MKSNPDSCRRDSTSRNISEFIAHVVRESPLHETGSSSLKKARTGPFPPHVRSRFGKLNQRRQSVKLFTTTTTTSRREDPISDILPRLKRLTSKESHCPTPTNSKSVFNLVNTIDQSNNKTDSLTNETIFPIPHPLYHKLDLSDRCENHNTSISEFIGKVLERSPRKPNKTLRVSKYSVGDWLKSAVSSTSPPQEGGTGGFKRKKRNKKLVSEGFAEYVRILSRRLANDVHLWFHSIKREAHLDGVESNAIITAFASSIRAHGPLYTMVCSLGDPIPENIAENDHYRSHGKIMIIFTHQTVGMLRITQKSCVKICPPWTFLPIGELSIPVILCTYFSFLCDSTLQHTDQRMEPDQLNNGVVKSLWRSVGSQDASRTLFGSALLTDESTMDAELSLREHSLASALKSQRWEDLTISGKVVHVTHCVNPQLTYETESVEIHYFHAFIQDVTGHISLVTLPERTLDSFPNLAFAHRLMNDSVMCNSVRMVSRENKLTSPLVMSVIQTLSNQNQKYCYCLAANTNVRLSIFTSPIRDSHPTTRLAKLSLEEELTTEKRFSIVGRLLHTQVETPLNSEECETGENTRPVPGAYLFLLGTNSALFQVYLDPILSQALLNELNQSIGKLLYLSSLFRTGLGERPTQMQGDQYSLLLELGQAGLWLEGELMESVRDRYNQIDPPPFPPFDRNSRLWSMVRVKGRILDVVEDSAYVWQVCDRCEEGVDEYSQSNELYCDECQSFVTNPIDKYKVDIMVECASTELVIQLHEATIKRLMPLIGSGKMYDKVELKGKEVELASCFIHECITLPNGTTKVFLEENIRL